MSRSLEVKELGTGITQRRDGRYSAKFKSRSGREIEKYFDTGTVPTIKKGTVS